MFSMQCRKNITVEDNKKRMNIANFMKIYANILLVLYAMIMTQNENDSINSILQHGRIVEKNYCIKFLCSIFKISMFDPMYQTGQMEGTYHLLSYKN